MKKAINIICFISIIAVLLMTPIIILRVFYVFNRDYKFIAEWMQMIFLIPALPLAWKGVSLAVRKNEIEPKVWLIRYGISMFLLLLLFAFTWKRQLEQLKDLPYAFRGEHLTVNGEIEQISFRNKGKKNAVQICTIGNVKFEIAGADFFYVEKGETYTLIYLPNSKFLIDVIDDNGNSKLKKQP